MCGNGVVIGMEKAIIIAAQVIILKGLKVEDIESYVAAAGATTPSAAL
jgi:hypothetical protein